MFSVVHLDLAGLLAELTGTDPSAWEEVEGPESGCGLDYWYCHAMSGEAYVNVDQTCITVSIEGEKIYEGDYLEDEWLSRFVTEDSSSG
jgi:hypothetical protein